MIEIIVEKLKENEMSTSSDVDMNPTGKPKKKKKKDGKQAETIFLLIQEKEALSLQSKNNSHE